MVVVKQTDDFANRKAPAKNAAKKRKPAKRGDYGFFNLF